jgi:hypothetical protein
MEGGSQASVISARSPLVVRRRNGSAVRVEGTNVTPDPRSPQPRRPERLHGRVGCNPSLTFIAAAALVSAIAPNSASAQVAPTASEAAAYTGCKPRRIVTGLTRSLSRTDGNSTGGEHAVHDRQGNENALEVVADASQHCMSSMLTPSGAAT